MHVYALAPSSPIASTPPPLPDEPSLAVLPFANMSGDPDQEYFADGMSEDLITALSKLPGMLVISRNSSFTYKGRPVLVSDVGRELGVHYVLEGSVRRAGRRVRITGQLVEAKSGRHLWAEHYDRELSDIFAVQDEVTGRIVEALELRLAPRDRPVVRAPTASAEAYDQFLRGRALYVPSTREHLARIRTHAERAIELDPEFAAAHALLAAADLAAWAGRWTDDRSFLESARRRAERACALDPGAGFVHGTLTLILCHFGEYERAIEEGRRAVELDPSSSHAHESLGQAFNQSDRPREAIPVLRKAIRLDPKQHYRAAFYVGVAYRMLGNLEAAEAELITALEQRPGFVPAQLNLVALYAHRGELERARAAGAELLRIAPDFEGVPRIPFRNPAHLHWVFDGLRKAGIDPRPDPGRA